MRVGLLVVALLALSVAANAAGTVYLPMDGLAAQGWKTTTTFVWGGSTNASVVQSTDYGANSFRFRAGSMPTSWEFQWAGVSTNAFSGMSLASITSLKIKNFGAFGDNANNWQPPTFTFILDKFGDGGTADRCIQWRPWASGSRDALKLKWNEYDAFTTGTWIIQETGVSYSSFAALKAALPNATFGDYANLPLDWGYMSQNAFNVGYCPLYDEDRAFMSDTSGYVDWFEVGVNGNVTRYDLGAVPEPASVIALLSGLVALVGLRRRK